MKNDKALLPVNRHLATRCSTWLVRALGLLLGAATLPAGAQTCDAGSSGLLDRWILATPLPVLLLTAVGVAFVLGVVAISAYLLLVPEIEDDNREGANQ